MFLMNKIFFLNLILYISFVQRKKNMIEGSNRAMTSIRDECLVDSETTNTILKSKKYFSQLSPAETYVNIISGISNLIESSRRAYILLPKGTKLIINDVLYSSKFRKILQCFKDIRRNGYHIRTMTENNSEYLQITTIKYGQKIILEKMKTLSSGLYCTNISAIESNMISNQKLHDTKIFILWHDRLGHLGNIMMRKIIESTNGHPLKDLKILLSKDLSCAACSLKKLGHLKIKLKMNLLYF
jgi:GAG-pre-integrase domain